MQLPALGTRQRGFKRHGGWLTLVQLQPTPPFSAWRPLSPSAKNPSAKPATAKLQALLLSHRTPSMQVPLPHSQGRSGTRGQGRTPTLRKGGLRERSCSLICSSFSFPFPSFLRKVSWPLSQNGLMLCSHVTGTCDHMSCRKLQGRVCEWGRSVNNLSTY